MIIRGTISAGLLLRNDPDECLMTAHICPLILTPRVWRVNAKSATFQSILGRIQIALRRQVTIVGSAELGELTLSSPR